MKSLVFILGSIVAILVSFASYEVYSMIFRNTHAADVAWLVTVGTYSAVLSPAKWLSFFKG